MSYFNDDQIAQLLRPINPRRVGKRDGMSHLEAYDVRAHLNRVVGFGRWSADLLDIERLYEAETTVGKEQKPGYAVAYRATVRLTVCAPDGTMLATYTECATGDGIMGVAKRADAHDFAIKTAESQALKRCAVNLGDQFGLSLYAKGSTNAVVGRTLISNVERSADAVDEHVTEVVPESEQVEPAPDNHVQSESPRGQDETNSDARELRVKDFTAQLLGADSRAKVATVSAQVMKEGLGAALTYDQDENALTLGALVDVSLKRVTARARASA